MRRNLSIVGVILLVIGSLILLNSLSYQREEEQLDSELFPNRSTFNAGPTGTRAFHDLLKETGHTVMRWRELPERLLVVAGERIDIFVVIGPTRISFDEDEARILLLWVRRGGTLVLVDRRPSDRFLKSTEWNVSLEQSFEVPDFLAPSDDVTAGVSPSAPSQATLFTRNVEAVMPSRFASAIRFTLSPMEYSASTEIPPQKDDQYEDDEWSLSEDTDEANDEEAGEPVSDAPVQHIVTKRGILLADWRIGEGRVALLSDPYIISNSGINQRDNLQLALNLVTGSGKGVIAFDEFHHGRGVTQNPMLGYFKGTPVLALAGQLVFLLLVITFTRARRFARPIPVKQVDRRSSLEFVASMAELQHRARAFDLAIENIYGRTRRALARNAGLEYNSPRSEIASRVALRTSLDPQQLESLMRECEQTINGGGITERRSLQLVGRLRELEAMLGLRRRGHEGKRD